MSGTYVTCVTCAGCATMALRGGEGGGVHRKVCRDTYRDMGKLQHILPSFLLLAIVTGLTSRYIVTIGAPVP